MEAAARVRAVRCAHAYVSWTRLRSRS
jgi:hypothetical protein